MSTGKIWLHIGYCFGVIAAWGFHPGIWPMIGTITIVGYTLIVFWYTDHVPDDKYRGVLDEKDIR